MREICMSGSMSGRWKRSMGELLGHRSPKGSATDNVRPKPPRHLSTPPCSRFSRALRVPETQLPICFKHKRARAASRSMIGTNGRVYTAPMTLKEASNHIRSWLARRVTQVLEPPTDHTNQVIALLEAAGGAAGNLVTDAQIAAFAGSYRAVVHTADRDFLRFPDIPCHFPLDP